MGLLDELKTSLKKATKRDDVVAQRPMGLSEPVQNLLQYFLNKDWISGVIVTTGRGGSFNPRTKEVKVGASDMTRGDSAAVHEITHAVLENVEGSHTAKQARRYDKYGLLNRLILGDIVQPKHWAEGRMGNPLYKKSFGDAVAPYRGNTPMDRMAKKTADRRRDAVRATIPSDERWSGISPAGEMNFGTTEEAQAYYLTQPEILNNPRTERNRELGMYLLDYDVPIELVRPVLDQLNEYSRGRP